MQAPAGLGGVEHYMQLPVSKFTLLLIGCGAKDVECEVIHALCCIGLLHTLHYAYSTVF